MEKKKTETLIWIADYKKICPKKLSKKNGKIQHPK